MSTAVMPTQQGSPNPSVRALPSLIPLYASLPANLRGKQYKPFFPNITALNVGAAGGQSGVQGFTIDPSFTFASWYGEVSIRKHADNTDSFTEGATVTLTDNQGNAFMPNNTAAELSTLFNVIGRSTSFVWAAPLIVPGQTGINVNVTNLGADANDYRFTFHGILINN